MQIALLVSVFVIATCGLIYELIASTLASYLLGDSVTQFSTVIGTYLFAMGIGSYLSRYLTRNLVSIFVRVELIIGLIGGSSAALLFNLFDHVASFRVLLYALVVIVGTLVGLEIPLLMRILSDKAELKEVVAKVFTFDYVGALVASLLFPLVFVPQLGLVQTSFFFGLANVGIALWVLYLFPRDIVWARAMQIIGWLVATVLIVGFIYSNKLVELAERSQYPEPVVFAMSTPYQRIIITRGGSDIRLYLNSNLQFSSRDEYRYHEPLIHMGMGSLPDAKDILILGGGDGLAARELLKYPQVQSITLVDLDPAMTRLFSTQKPLVELNHSSLLSPKLKVINSDAFRWLQEHEAAAFDFIIIDFPDPSNFSISKLYSTAFFKLAAKVIRPGGAMVVQSTSPLVARKTYWCIDATLRATGWLTRPYHAYVPAFGEWGFILASRAPLPEPTIRVPDLRFVDADLLQTMRDFPPDMAFVPAEVNTLNNQILVRYFEQEWSEYSH